MCLVLPPQLLSLPTLCYIFSLEGTCNSGGWGRADLTHFCPQGPAQRKVPRGLCVYFGECDETLLGRSPSIKARIPSHGKGCGPACTYSRNSERGGMTEARGIKVLRRGPSTTLLSNVPSWLKALPDL